MMEDNYIVSYFMKNKARILKGILHCAEGDLRESS